MRDHHMNLPLSFRSEFLRHIMPMLRAGECCSLIGVSGVGKSNLVQFLRRLDVQEHYWGDDRAWIVPIDAHGLVAGDIPPRLVLLEAMMHRIIIEGERRQLPPTLLNDLTTMHAKILEQPIPLLALRYLERTFARLCDLQQRSLIFVFDQFENIWGSMDAEVFQNLRFLRDEFKYKIAYLVITRERLPRIRQRSQNDLSSVESFWELFVSHVFGLGMYSTEDAKVLLDHMAHRRGYAMSTNWCQTLLDLSGRHPGLIRALLWATDDRTVETIQTEALLQFPAVAEECQKLWKDLTADEQLLAKRIAIGLYPTATATASTTDEALMVDMRIKGLVVRETAELFSPVFTAYIRQLPGAERTGIVLSIRERRVWIDGQPLTSTLPPREFQLLAYLARHAGAICHREEIMRELYQERMYDANDERLDTLLRRLRESLGDSGRRHIMTHRGVGVQLKSGAIQDV